MKFSGIDMQGPYKAEIVVDASALSWTASDERRMVYDQTTKQLWTADNTQWKLSGRYNNIPQGSVMWVYADSAPAGWSLYASSGDTLLAVKGGATYVTGGTTAGDFTLPAHQHTMQNHTHTASGTTDVPTTWTSSYDAGSVNNMAYHTHTVSATTGGPSTNTTGAGGAVTGFRPRARVGILCTR